MRRTARGQILPVVMVCLLLLVIIIGAVVKWTQSDTNWAVKNTRTTTAANFAEAAIDRGAWKLQSTTATWFAASAGTVIPGYNFDITYNDIPGGTYRIKFSSGAPVGSPYTGLNNEITITAEGRDTASKEVSAISAVYQNQTIYSPLMAGGMVTWSPGLGIFWGPIISQGNIVLQNGIDAWYFPQKYAAGDVIGTAANPRDITYPSPPNTDNVEWWAHYSGVPNVPVLDFAALRSSAAATGTLNVYGCGCAATPQYTVNGVAVASWDLRTAAECSNPFPPPGTADLAPHTNHFGNSTNFVKQNLGDTTFSNNYVWYWDGDVALEGYSYNGTLATSLRGTVIVRGNLTINSSGDLVYHGHVPVNAWQQEVKLTSTTFDTAAANEYPADAGYHANESTFRFGAEQFCVPLSGHCNEISTVGIRGFVYVGGNLTLLSYLDINGAIWVNGTVTASGGSYSQFTSIFYDDSLQVPALNVILFRQSWQEVTPSAAAWN